MSLSARLEVRRGHLELQAEIETGAGTLALVGPNGAGKSSLLLGLLGAVPVLRGRIQVAGQLLFDSAAGLDLPLEQRRLGYVPQDYGLFPHLTVEQNIEFAVASGTAARTARQSRVVDALSDLGLEGLAQRYPRQLSGGEKQRVALARALSVGPRALLLDEPLSALDVRAQSEVGNFLKDYLARLALPTIVVLHRAVDAKLLGQRIAVLETGRLTQIGSWQELCARPASPYVEAFVASANLEHPVAGPGRVGAVFAR